MYDGVTLSRAHCRRARDGAARMAVGCGGAMAWGACHELAGWHPHGQALNNNNIIL